MTEKLPMETTNYQICCRAKSKTQWAWALTSLPTCTRGTPGRTSSCQSSEDTWWTQSLESDWEQSFLQCSSFSVRQTERQTDRTARQRYRYSKIDIWVLCILTSFQVLRAPESWLKFFFQPFSTFFLNFKCFLINFCLKSLKRAQKNISTSFRVCASPEIWSKYTTSGLVEAEKSHWTNNYKKWKVKIYQNLN